MLKRWAGVLVAIALLPMLVGYTAAFIAYLASVPAMTAAQLAFLIGTTAYLAWHTMVAKPVRAYVFGHELMHAVATWASGGQVKAFKVSAKGGHVGATKNNLLIALAPYLIPSYSILAALAWVVAGWFWDTQPYTPWFYGVMGATLAFHWAFTAEFVKTQQPDLVESGRLLSLTLIYWVNLGIVALAVTLVTPPMRFWTYLADGYQRSGAFYTAIIRQLFF